MPWKQPNLHYISLEQRVRLKGTEELFSLFCKFISYVPFIPAHAVLPVQRRYRCAGLGLLQNRQDQLTQSFEHPLLFTLIRFFYFLLQLEHRQYYFGKAHPSSHTMKILPPVWPYMKACITHGEFRQRLFR